MGYPVYFEGANTRLGPPEGMTEGEVQTMYAYQGDGRTISCWQLTPEELQQVITDDGKVWLSLWTKGVPPHFIGSEKTVIDLHFNLP